MKSRMAITIGCARSGVACGSQHRIGAGYHADRPLVGGAEQHDAAEAGVAPDAYTRASAMTSNVTGRRKCVVWSIVLIGR